MPEEKLYETKMQGRQKKGILRKAWMKEEAEKIDIPWEGIRQITIDRGEWSEI